ncbi:MAG: thioredoxin family protein [Acidobacteriota bacterium]
MRFARFLLLAAIVSVAAVFLPAAERALYPDPSLAKAQIAAALKTAARTHKRVLLDFGGNWCGDCFVLDMYFHTPQNRPLLEHNYVVVYVNVGELDTNLDIADRYQVPVRHGVPGVAVLSDTGKLLYSARNKELEYAVQHSDPAAVTRFLAQWKAGSKGCSVVAMDC